MNPIEKPLLVPWWLWCRLVTELRRRGQKRRESGAFLLGLMGSCSSRVQRFVCYDDLDPNALNTGIVTFDSSGYSRLWERCRKLGLEVLGDVHTHPGSSTAMSTTDLANPMIGEAGHIALIIPRFAEQMCWGFRGVSVNEYLGRRQWRRWQGKERSSRVRMSLW